MVPYVIWVMLAALVAVIGMWVRILQAGREQEVAKRYLLLLHILLTVALICGVIVVVKEYFFTGEYATWSGVLGLVGAISSVGLPIVVRLTWRVAELHARMEEIEKRLRRYRT